MGNTSDIRILSLCAGYGGLELGLARVLQGTFRVVAVEIEAYAVANLVSKAEESKLAIEAVWPDVKTFPAEKFRGCFDIIAGGFPCQPFSVAGKQQGANDPRHLWPHIARIIKTIKPLFVCLENVPGLLSTRTLDNRPDLQEHLAQLGEAGKLLDARGRWYLSQHRQRLTNYWLRTEGVSAYGSIYYSLRDMGYKVEAGLFTATEVGAPHKRERLFILGKLANAGYLPGCAKSRQQQKERAEELSRSDKLGNSRGFESRGLSDNERQGISEVGKASKGLVDAISNGEQTCQAVQLGMDGYILENCRRDKSTNRPERSNSILWPARPGQQQYDWEEPRTIEPGMGRTVDGTGFRVDRLRLLGNGCVWQQVGEAYLYLRDKF